jgi:hypothetical protein
MVGWPADLLAEEVKAMKRLLMIFAMTSVIALAADQSSKPVTINGWVSDSMCGAKHVGGGGSECVKKCVEGGGKPVFVDDAKKQVWSIDDPASVTSHYGHHVAVVATMDSANKSVHITKLTMLPDQGTAKQDTSMH